jgi:gluconolactonase
VFADLRGPESGVPDGMKVDSTGNVYCGGAGGIYILDPKGRKLGRIVHGYPATTNVAFGGGDWKTLYFTSRPILGAVNLKIAGLPGRINGTRQRSLAGFIVQAQVGRQGRNS